MTDSIAKKPTIFVYKMTTDDGGAPCVQDKTISLCLCKPRIRMSAKENDWIIGMGGKSVKKLRDRPIYVMQVEKRVNGKDYYAQNGEYWNREDCAYKWDDNNGNYTYKEGAKYHPLEDKMMGDDLGREKSGYPRAFCLVSSKFVYFGDSEKEIWKNNEYKSKFRDIEAIQKIYEELPRDYKKNHIASDHSILLDYIHYILDTYGIGEHGSPTHKEERHCRKCSFTKTRISNRGCHP